MTAKMTLSQVRYSVFRASNGKHAVVIINQEANRTVTAQVDVPHAGKLVVAAPKEPDGIPLTSKLQIPSRSAVVVIEP